MHALERVQPDAVLIEGPPDANDLIALAAHPQLVPPVALLIYVPNEPRQAVLYPFAHYSPEWQAISLRSLESCRCDSSICRSRRVCVTHLPKSIE